VYERTGTVPSLKLVRTEFPAFKPTSTGDPITVLIDNIRAKKMYNDGSKALAEIQRELRSDPYAGVKRLREVAAEMAAEHMLSEDLDITQRGAVQRERYRDYKRNKGKRGIPWLWPALTKATRGKHPGQYILMAAQKKSVKTYLALADAVYVHREHGVVPAYFTRELTQEQIEERVVLIRAGISAAAYFDGKLSKSEWLKFKCATREWRGNPPFMVCAIEGTGREAVLSIKETCRKYGVQTAYVDGTQDLGDSFTWEDQAKVHTALKMDLAMPKTGLNICVVGITHTKSKDDVDVKYTSAAADRIDAQINMKREEIHKDNKEVELHVPFARDGGDGTTLVAHADFDRMDFTQKYEGAWQGGEEESGGFHED
jgi:hypothetical protein